MWIKNKSQVFGLHNIISNYANIGNIIGLDKNEEKDNPTAPRKRKNGHFFLGCNEVYVQCAFIAPAGFIKPIKGIFVRETNSRIVVVCVYQKSIILNHLFLKTI